MRRVLACLIAALALTAGSVAAETVRVAVAANFRAAAEDLGAAFAAETGHELGLSAASTGILYAQISRGAPFDVFLAADQTRPVALGESGAGVAETRFTYATGRLVFIARDPALIGPEGPKLDAVRTLSIANPETAPYGAAAVEAMEGMPGTPGRVAQAQNVAGVVAAVMSGAADGGFAALSLVRGVDGLAQWPVPAAAHAPIRQDAILVARARDNATARGFLDWLRGDAARRIIRSHGYDVD